MVALHPLVELNIILVVWNCKHIEIGLYFFEFSSICCFAMRHWYICWSPRDNYCSL